MASLEGNDLNKQQTNHIYDDYLESHACNIECYKKKGNRYFRVKDI